MKRFLPCFLVLLFVVTMYGYAFGWGNGGGWSGGGGWNAGENWQSWDNQKKGEFSQKDTSKQKYSRQNYDHQGKSDRKKRFCSWGQEESLVELLNELDQPPPKDMRGGASEVRWKYSIIRKLRKYDDCRAEDALEKISKENLCEEQPSGETLCLKWSAEAAREEIESAADLKKLLPSTPIAEQIKIIRKYTKRPYKNNFAVNKIASYLNKQAVIKPETFVPLLVELFPGKNKTEEIARRYPQLADKGLEIIFTAKEYDDVWWGITMARSLGRSQFIKKINAIAFEEKGNINYSNNEKTREIQAAALNYLRAFMPDSQPYLRAAQAVSNGLALGIALVLPKGTKQPQVSTNISMTLLIILLGLLLLVPLEYPQG